MSFLVLVLVPNFSIWAVKFAIKLLPCNDFSSPIRNKNLALILSPFDGFSSNAYCPPEANFPISVVFKILATEVSKVSLFASKVLPLYPFVKTAISGVSLTFTRSALLSGTNLPQVLLLCK